MVAPNTVGIFQVNKLRLDKMVEEMKSGDDILRTKVLREINEDYHQADKLNFSLESEILY